MVWEVWVCKVEFFVMPLMRLSHLHSYDAAMGFIEKMFFEYALISEPTAAPGALQGGVPLACRCVVYTMAEERLPSEIENASPA